MGLKYFGTDGIRGRVDGPLIHAGFMRRMGVALRHYLQNTRTRQTPLRIVIGRDPRSSGEALEKSLAEGFGSRDLHLYTLGVVPTPAVSMAVRDLHADLGIALTASHNPVSDNGIKLFDHDGLKLALATEAEIETLIDGVSPDELSGSTGEVHTHAYDARAFYINYLRAILHERSLHGWKVVLDTAHGSTAETSPQVLRHLGAEIISIGASPDGSNINQNVGSEHPQRMAQAVRQHGAQIGIAHDGDGDRLVVCDENGVLLHGDELLGLLALHALRTQALRDRTLVATVQSNFGLDRTIEAAGGRVERVDIGDRNVLLHMCRHDYNLGGESSGHLIFRDHAVAGDGLLAALKTAEVMLTSGQPLSQLRKAVTLFPQLSATLDVEQKRPLADCAHLQQARERIERTLAGRGRLLVRYSGTENKLRLLVEAECEQSLANSMRQLQEAARRDLLAKSDEAAMI